MTSKFGGWNRPAASAFRARHYHQHRLGFGKEDSNLHACFKGRPTVSRFERHARVELAYRFGNTVRLTARPSTLKMRKRKERSRTLKAHRSPGFERAVAVRLAFLVSARRQESACVLRLTAGAPVPARTPPESSRRQSGMAGLELAMPCSKQADWPGSHPECLVHRQVPSGVDPHVRHAGGRLPLGIMGTFASPIVKAESTGWDSNPSPPYEGGSRRWTTSACIG